jgi:hypothetical protein
VNFDQTVVHVVVKFVTGMSKILFQNAVHISPFETDNVSFAAGTRL